MKQVVLAVLITTTISGVVQADETAVEQRQALFEAIENETDTLEEQVDAGDLQNSIVLAQRLQRRVQQLQRLFPANSQGEGRSRDGVWENWTDFSIRLEKLEAAYRGAHTAAQAGNSSRARQAVEAATSSCRSCHMKYRSLW